MGDKELTVRINEAEANSLINRLREIRMEAERTALAVASVGASFWAAAPGGVGGGGLSALPMGSNRAQAGVAGSASAVLNSGPLPMPPAAIGSGPVAFPPGGAAPTSPNRFMPPYAPNPAFQTQYMYMQQAGAGIALGAGVAGNLISSQLDFETQRRLYGGYHPSDQAAIFARGAGALIGGGLGLLGGPIGGAIGAVIGGGIFESVARYIGAPIEERFNSLQALRDIGAVENQGPFGRFGSANRRAARLNEITGIINRDLGWASPFRLNDESMLSRGYAELSGGLIAGGIDPLARTGTRVLGPTAAEMQADIDGLRAGRYGAIFSSARDAIRYSVGGREQTGETFIRRIGQLYGNQVERGVSIVNPIFASLPETGGNMTDVLLRFGPTATNLFNRIQHDDLRSPVPMEQLMVGSATYRGSLRQAQIGGLQIRGSGAAAAAGYQRAQDTLAGLPGGPESLTYAENRQRLAGATLQGYQQADTVAYDIPRVQLEGQMTRAQMMPYAPSRIFAMSARDINLNTRQIQDLAARRADLSRRGLLSEDAEYGITSQMEQLRNRNASDFAMLTEGRDNLVPGLVAGRRRTVGAFDSGMLAATAFMRAGLPYRNQGAISGRQLQLQNDYADLIGLGGGEIAPYSRTQALNNGGAGAAAMERAAAAMERAAKALEQGAMQGPRGNRSVGNADGLLGTKDPTQGTNSYDRNGY